MRPLRLFGIAGLILVVASVPQLSYGATLVLSPSSAQITSGQTVAVTVLVTSTDQAMNAASGNVVFPSNLEVVSVSKAGSIATLWAQEPSFSNAEGTVSFEGVVLNPGYMGSAGKLITITFRGKTEGNAKLDILGGSVLANDGKGTEILSGVRASEITVGTKSVAPQNEVAEEAGAGADASGGSKVTITSPTHPDQARWYKNDSPEFTWALPKGALEVRTLIGENPRANPNVRYTPPISKKLVENLPDGTYYFYVQVRTADGWGAVSRYTVNIDTTPPAKFHISLAHTEDTKNPQPIIHFNTTDAVAGIDRYEVKVGTGGPLRTLASADTNPYTLPVLEPGKHIVMVTAYDRAGNTESAEEEITIEGIDAPIVDTYPETMNVGDLLRIRGTTYTNATVDIAVRKDGEEVVSESTKSNSLGDFGIIISKRLWPGEYTFTARVTDAQGARSLETEEFPVRVELHFFSDALTFILNYFFIALSILIGLSVITAISIWSWFKILRMTRVLKRESDEAQTMLHRSFGVLRADLENHIAKLRKARSARTLTQEEVEFLSQFDDDLGQAEIIISKEIDDTRTPKRRRKKEVQ